MSRLSRNLQNGIFTITVELAPPRGSDPSKMITIAKDCAAEGATAFNVTDNQRAQLHLSPVAAGKALIDAGLEPIVQLTCRDRNVLALQSELLAASFFGIENILSLTGDPIEAGDYRSGKAVFDLDTVKLLQLTQIMNTGLDSAGKKLDRRTEFFVGAALNPSSDTPEWEIKRGIDKIESGARFFQTQPIFSVDKVKKFQQMAQSISSKIIGGVIFLKSIKMAHFLNEKLPGVKIPSSIFDRLERAKNFDSEAINIAAEQVVALKECCDGAHIMSIGKEEVVPLILKRVREIE